MNSKELKVFCVNHVINDVPMEIWERQYNDRKHLTDSIVRNGRIVETNKPMFLNAQHYKEHALDYAYTDNGNIDIHSVTRKSKKRCKETGNWIRVFGMCLLLLDHDVIVTTDPTDTHIVSVTYKYTPNEFLVGAQA